MIFLSAQIFAQYSLRNIAYPLLIHSNWLISLEIKLLTLSHGINIPYKVLKHNSKQVW